MGKEFKGTQKNVGGETSEEVTEEEQKEKSRKRVLETQFSAFDQKRKRPVMEILLKDTGLNVFPKAACKKLPKKTILQGVNAVSLFSSTTTSN